MRGETILCISTGVWGSVWSGPEQYMSRFAPQNRVLFFETGRHPGLSATREVWRDFPNFFAMRSRVLKENLIVIPTPSRLPYARNQLPSSVLRVTSPLVTKINASIQIHHIRWAMRELDVQAPILWLYVPNQIDLVGKFGEKLVCYFNYDEYASYVQNTRIKELIYHLDEELTRRADMVFATSRAQWEHRKKINRETYLVPNAVDFELFHRSGDPDLTVAADIACLPRPIIGYAGSLGNQIDLVLLNRVADAYPACSLVLVGPDRLAASTAKAELKSRHNVFFLGQKRVDELPAYLKAFDAALIPYVLVGYPLTAYPLKLHEYLAAGRASVATAMPELRPYCHVVRIAETHQEFISQIREAMEDYSPETIQARIAVARENTWDHRVAEIYRILERRLCVSEGVLQ